MEKLWKIYYCVVYVYIHIYIHIYIRWKYLEGAKPNLNSEIWNLSGCMLSGNE